MSSSLKPVEWVGSSLEDLKDFPEDVQQVVGYALYLAQCGEKHPSGKPLKGFKGAGVLEVMEDFDGDTNPSCLHCETCWRNLCLTRLSKEIKARNRYTKAGY